MTKFNLTVKEFVDLALNKMPIYIDWVGRDFQEYYLSQEIYELNWDHKNSFLSFKGTFISDPIEIENVTEFTQLDMIKDTQGNYLSCYVDEKVYSNVKKKIIGYFCPVKSDEGWYIAISESNDKINITFLGDHYLKFLESNYFMFNKVSEGLYNIIDDSFEGCLNLFELLITKGFMFSNFLNQDITFHDQYEIFLKQFKDEFITDSIDEFNIDKIFKKIQKSGIESLTKKETETLKKYSESL